jgi:urea transport system substrate-binding protein
LRSGFRSSTTGTTGWKINQFRFIRVAVLPSFCGCRPADIHGNGAISSLTGALTPMQVVRPMPQLRVPVGILISSDGPYSVVSRSMLQGALQAVDEVNTGGAAVQIDPIIGNPGGDLARYAVLGQEMLAAGVKHVVGCYTSSSRKEVLPLFEKADALLWYPSHYEGFESSLNVVYTGAVANQHLLPLVEYLVEKIGRTAFCIGSDYIWAWESNRILGEAIGHAGGRVITEQYFPVDSTDFAQAIETILASRPSFVFNTLIGISSYQFLRDLRAACVARGIDQPATIPIASCTLSEPELQAIGPGACDGHITASVYFASIDTPENRRFRSSYAARYPESPTVSADAEASYNAVRLLAMALVEAGTTEIAAVKRAVARQGLRAPQGMVRIDPETMHGSLTPRIGRSTTDHQFETLFEAPHPLRADPYLIWSSSRFGTVTTGSKLRIAS